MLGGLFKAIGKGVGAVGKGVVKANKYTIGKAGQVAKAGMGKATDIANKASGYEPDLRGPAPKISVDAVGNAQLSTPKVQDPNSFKGRGGFAGAVKRMATGDPNAGSGRAATRKLLPPEGETPKAASAKPGKLQRPDTDFSPKNESQEFNPNWRNWKAKK